MTILAYKTAAFLNRKYFRVIGRCEVLKDGALIKEIIESMKPVSYGDEPDTTPLPTSFPRKCIKSEHGGRVVIYQCFDDSVIMTIVADKYSDGYFLACMRQNAKICWSANAQITKKTTFHLQTASKNP